MCRNNIKLNGQVLKALGYENIDRFRPDDILIGQPKLDISLAKKICYPHSTLIKFGYWVKDDKLAKIWDLVKHVDAEKFTPTECELILNNIVIMSSVYSDTIFGAVLKELLISKHKFLEISFKGIESQKLPEDSSLGNIKETLFKLNMDYP